MVGIRGGRSAAIRRAAAGCTLLMVAAVTGCGGDDKPAAAKHRPVAMAGKSGAALPVPHGRGSKVAHDFNGDGAPDLVLDDLVHDGLGDDAGIGVVYGKKGHGLVPGARQLLRPAKYAAPTKGETPAAFDSEASCDLDKDGFTDLVVSTDPPFDGQGQPPVPLQILFGGPGGLTHQGVKLVVPAQARFGNDWPDQPVCGDFDGDGSVDLTVHASGGRLSFLPGPFTRKGTPRAAGKPLTAPGNVPVGPAFDVDRDGYDDLLVRRTSAARHRPGSSWAARRDRPAPAPRCRPASASRWAVSPRAPARTPRCSRPPASPSRGRAPPPSRPPERPSPRVTSTGTAWQNSSCPAARRRPRRSCPRTEERP